MKQSNNKNITENPKNIIVDYVNVSEVVKSEWLNKLTVWLEDEEVHLLADGKTYSLCVDNDEVGIDATYNIDNDEHNIIYHLGNEEANPTEKESELILQTIYNKSGKC